jgi:F0F1-type ATP synthase membrane subunit c/vacuolar-type H+-ATPase subunit K
MTQPNFKNNLMKSALVGAVGYGVAKFGLGYSGDIVVNGMTLDSNIGFGLATGIGSLGASTVSQYATSQLTQDKAKQMKENRFIQPALVGAITYASARAMGNVPNPLPVIGLGAGSEIVGSYAQDSFMSAPSAPKTSSASSSAFV